MSASPEETPGASTSTAHLKLACNRCRVKKQKCNGESPCTSCIKTKSECVRATQRKRKRTRKEMMEAEMDLEIEKRARLLIAEQAADRTQVPDSKPLARRSRTSSNSGLNALYAAAIKRPQSPSPVASSSSATMYATESPVSQPANSPQWPPPNSDQIMNALSNQIAFLEGDPGQSQTLKVHYYRLTGSTAIHPGFNRIAIKLRCSKPASSTPSTHFMGLGGSHNILGDPSGPYGPQPTQFSHQLPEPTANPSLPPPLDMAIVDELSHNPDRSLVDVFFKHFGQHFPFLRKTRVQERLQEDTMSAFLLHAMNAVAIRFSPGSTHTAAEYIAAAWRLALPLLRLPSTDVVAGLLLLSWAEFGENSESGLWNFTGMAIRMAIDLGLHKAVDDQLQDCCNPKILFWVLYVQDRVLALGTGRAGTIPEDVIEVPLPCETDFPAIRSEYPGAPVHAQPFIRVVRLFSLCGRIADVLNGRGCTRTLVAPEAPSSQGLLLLQNDLVEFINTLSPALAWSVENFRAYAARDQGGIFLFMHLWAHAVLALVNLGNLSGFETPAAVGIHRSFKLSLASSRQIADYLVFADLFDAASYCATPFLNQTLFIAGVAFVHQAQAEEMGVSEGAQHLNQRGPTASGSAAFLSGLVRQNLSVVLKALQRMSCYWSGLGYIISVLEQRASGLGWPQINFSITNDKTNNFISLPDSGIMKRLTGKPVTWPSQQQQQQAQNQNQHYQHHQQHRNMGHMPQQQQQQSQSQTESWGQQLYPTQGQGGHSNQWSFESLLASNYQVEEVTSSSLDFDLSGVFPDGFAW